MPAIGLDPQVSSSDEAVAAGPATILVVDDDPLNRMLLAGNVRAEGHRTVEADSGEAALQLLGSTPVDVVLLDILMPGLDGFGVLGRMKSDPRMARIPVIVVSAVEGCRHRPVHRARGRGLPSQARRPLILRARLNAGLAKVRLAELEQRRVRDTFARFLPETVVDEMLENQPDDPRIGARRLNATVIFNDLRGFTTFAEARPVEVVIEVLNRYLTTMSDAVLDHRGHLVSYLGDGMMSVFGAPVETPGHADQAVATAIDMHSRRLPELNAWLTAEGISAGFDLGIGLHSGPVMSGNVGSLRRLEYAAIGDTTNTAARIEGLTKQLHVPLLLSESVIEALTEPIPALRFVEEVAPRGRHMPVRLYTVEQ